MTSEVDSSECLARSTITRLYAAWSSTAVINQIVPVAYDTTVDLLTATSYIIQADPVAPVVVGWIYNANIVEMLVNQITVVYPPATPYLRNTSVDSTSTPVPVRVVAFS